MNKISKHDRRPITPNTIPTMANFLLFDSNPLLPKTSPNIAHIIPKVIIINNVVKDIKLSLYQSSIHGNEILIIPNIKEQIA